MNQEVNVNTLFQVIGEQQVTIKVMETKIRELSEELARKAKEDEITEDN